MKEDRAAAALDRRGIIVAQHDDDVVKAILPPEVFGAGGVWMDDTAIVVAVLARIAPAVRATDRTKIQACAGAGYPVGAVEGFTKLPGSDGGGSIAFAFGDLAAGAAQCASEAHATSLKHTCFRLSANRAHNQRRMYRDGLMAFAGCAHYTLLVATFGLQRRKLTQRIPLDTTYCPLHRRSVED